MMLDTTLLLLAKVVLPLEVLDHFAIVEIESTETEIHIYLDELMKRGITVRSHISESKGFIAPVTITDFPIRDHKVLLILRRRRWLDIRTGKSFILPLNIAAAR